MKVKSEPITLRFDLDKLDAALRFSGLKRQQLFDKLLTEYWETFTPVLYINAAKEKPATKLPGTKETKAEVYPENVRFKIVNGKKVFK